MFDSLIKDLASRFGLGDKAPQLLQLLLAYITNPQGGGIAGFLDRFKTAGLGGLAQSWLGGGAAPQAPSTGQLEQVFGGSGGLLSLISSKLGLSGSTATSALAFVLPQLISRLTPGGSVPAVVPAEVSSFIGNAGSWLSGGAAAAVGAASAAGAAASANASAAAQAAGGGLKRFLPWIILAVAVLLGLAYCKNRTPESATVPAPSTAPSTPAPAPAPEPAPAPAPAAAAPAADATVPAGAGILGAMMDGVPALKVYFDTGKTDIAAPEFATAAKPLVDYAAANPTAKLVVSGFNDPTGDAAANAVLSKSRAEAVAAALKTAGVAESAIVLEKPADATQGQGPASNAEARRVEVTVRK